MKRVKKRKDRTNAKRQRRYIRKLKTAAENGKHYQTILKHFDARLRRVEEMVTRERADLLTLAYVARKLLGERNDQSSKAIARVVKRNQPDDANAGDADRNGNAERSESP